MLPTIPPVASSLETSSWREGEGGRPWRSWTRAGSSSAWSRGRSASPASAPLPSPASFAPGEPDCQDQDASQTKKRNNKRVRGSGPPPAKRWEHIDLVLMKLSASALQFLGKIYRTGSLTSIHCYCFIRLRESEELILYVEQKKLNAKIAEPIFHRTGMFKLHVSRFSIHFFHFKHELLFPHV